MNAPLHAQPTPVALAERSPIAADVPPESPLPLHPQDLSRPFVDPAAPQRFCDRRANWYRASVMLATGLLTTAFTYQMALFLAAGGLTVFEVLALAFYALTFGWIAFAFATALAGAVVLAGGEEERPQDPGPPLRVALLVLTYNEPPARVFGSASAMLTSLAEAKSRHGYDLFVLSDTTSPQLAEEEQAAFHAVRQILHGEAAFYYRRRADNSKRKVGNIADWLSRWGGAYEAFLVLDADSVMSARAIEALSDELARDESLGLVQSASRIVGARTLFARIQQFSSAAVGPLVAAGAAAWMGPEANYFGHNAILRTRAFAASADLPRLPGRPPFGGCILSHDFVEAAMLRRAGWGVRMSLLKVGSYEETPPSLIDHVLRDRRWCQGNLQHLLVLASAGFHPVSRFHLLQGIMAYLVSLFWALFLLLGVAAQLYGDGFLGDRTLSAGEPSSELDRGLAVLIGTFLILLAPKLMGVANLAVMHDARRCGGRAKIFGSAVLEIVLSSLIAPILMVQQTCAVLCVFLGIDGGWSPQRRDAAERRPWLSYLQFHAVETASGVALVIMILGGLLTHLLWPVAASLLLAAPISRLTSATVGYGRTQSGLFATQEDVVQPAVIARSCTHAQRIVEDGRAKKPPLEFFLQAAE